MLAPPVDPEESEPVYKASYVCGDRPLRTEHGMLEPGEPVPHAEDWPRVEAWVRSGRIVALK